MVRHDAAPEGNVPTGEYVTLEYTILNSVGDAPPAGKVELIYFSVTNADGASGDIKNIDRVISGSDIDDADLYGDFQVSSRNPGTVTVLLKVRAFNESSEIIAKSSIIFTGESVSLSVTEVTNLSDIDGSSAPFKVTAHDASDLETTFAEADLDRKIVDSNDDIVTNISIQSLNSVDENGNNYQVVVGDNVVRGAYSIILSLSGVVDSETTTSFAVAGPPATVRVDLSYDDPHQAVNTGGTVTVTVTDSDGALVAPTSVEFKILNGTNLLIISSGAKQGTTDEGVATARFMIINDLASSTTLGVLTDGGVIGYKTHFVSGAAVNVTLNCLSALNGFATYTCEVDSSARELFGLVEGRGVTAIHLWNGSDWVRYAIVDGAPVPGSREFNVTEDDILYLSN